MRRDTPPEDLTGADPISLERLGWQALATSGDAAAAFYGQVLDGDVTMLLPGGMMIEDRDTAVRSMSGAPWSDYELEAVRVRNLSSDVSIVTYRVTAQRDGAPRYSGLISSTFVQRTDGWKLAVHQQTPV